MNKTEFHQTLQEVNAINYVLKKVEDYISGKNFNLLDKNITENKLSFQYLSCFKINYKTGNFDIKIPVHLPTIWNYFFTSIISLKQYLKNLNETTLYKIKITQKFHSSKNEMCVDLIIILSVKEGEVTIDNFTFIEELNYFDGKWKGIKTIVNYGDNCTITKQHINNIF